jgi:hypothetical protein
MTPITDNTMGSMEILLLRLLTFIQEKEQKAFQK